MKTKMSGCASVPKQSVTAICTTGWQKPWGVTVAVCTHNGAGRVSETLVRLAAQQVPPRMEWEVLVIDNASTDDAVNQAKRAWPLSLADRFRVVSESQLGLTHARCRALADARFEIVSFVDDDNWVCADWVRVVAEIMAHRPRVGACGGMVEAQCEVQPPWWFERYQEFYAIGPQHHQEGDITWERGYLWGAGLTVRYSAWAHLTCLGFRFLLMDRRGTRLHSGGDAEICLALRLAGWTIWYDPRLYMRHFVPASRLRWSYLKQVVRGFGVASPSHKAYYAVRENKENGLHVWLRGNWQSQLAACLLKLFQQAVRLLIMPPVREGNPAVLELESLLGTTMELMRQRRAYDESFWRVRDMFGGVVAQPVLSHELPRPRNEEPLLLRQQ
ncbi:MAG: hypothetical protein C5B60_07245 [Chloroflexi bacterium]|nr:MAG: hypothetical protein C5B60_07245 [Chloroflexota bacterium]